MSIASETFPPPSMPEIRELKYFVQYVTWFLYTYIPWYNSTNQDYAKEDLQVRKIMIDATEEDTQKGRVKNKRALNRSAFDLDASHANLSRGQKTGTTQPLWPGCVLSGLNGSASGYKSVNFVLKDCHFDGKHIVLIFECVVLEVSSNAGTVTYNAVLIEERWTLFCTLRSRFIPEVPGKTTSETSTSW
jgi:hypothetical protein